MKINGKEYTLGEITFGTMCKLENMGINVSNMMDKPMNTVLAFATIAIGDKKLAEKEMNEHLMHGGKLDSIVEGIQEAMSKSGFMKAIRADKTDTQDPPETTAE